jgi:hypothetical protein
LFRCHCCGDRFFSVSSANKQQKQLQERTVKCQQTSTLLVASNGTFRGRQLILTRIFFFIRYYWTNPSNNFYVHAFLFGVFSNSSNIHQKERLELFFSSRPSYYWLLVPDA